MIRLFIITIILILPTSSKAGQIADCITFFYKQKPEAASICMDIPDDDKNDAIKKIIGDMYYWGWGDKIKKDYKKAILWYKRAAGKGNKEAAYNLGVIYETGVGVAIDYTKSAQWYRSAAKKGYKDAQFNLANMYSKGAGVNLDQTKAVRWYIKAANQGDETAQFNLGNRYAIGNGIKVNLIESYKWYSLSLRSGNGNAKTLLSVIAEQMDTMQIDEAKILVEKWRPEIN